MALITVASSGADFTTIQAAVDSIADNPTEAQTIRVTEAYNAQSTTLVLTLPNSNAVALTLEGATDVRPNAFSRAEANACARIVVSSGVAISEPAGWLIQGLAIETTASGQQTFNNMVDLTVKRCIIINADNWITVSNGNCTIENSVLVSGAHGIMWLGQTVTIWNCSMVYAGGFAGMWGNGGAFDCQNVAIQGNGTDFNGAGNTNCLSSDASATAYPSESGVFTNSTVAAFDCEATFADGDFPGGDATAFDADLATDMAGNARDSTPDVGASQPSGSPPVTPDATYAEDSQPCEGSNGTITPDYGTGGLPTSAAVASGSLPTGYTLNADGTISKVGASMVVGDIGSRTVYVNLTNASGTQSNVPVPIVITANPPVNNWDDNALVASCKATPVDTVVNTTHASGPAVVAGTYVLVGSKTDVSLDADDGQLHMIPDRGQWSGPTPLAIEYESAGGQVGSTPITVEFDFSGIVNLNDGGTWNVQLRFGGGGGDSGDTIIPSRIIVSRIKTSRISTKGRFGHAKLRN